MIYTAVEKEARRIAYLEGYSILDTMPEKDFDDIAKLAADVCQTPIALVVFVDEHRQWFKAKVGMNNVETPRAVSFCHYTIQGTDLFIVPDAILDERFVSSPLVTSDPHIRFYAGAPLTTSEGVNLGTVCVIDRVPRTLTDAQKKDLQSLARQILNQLELRKRLSEEAHVKQDLERRVQDRTQALIQSMEEAQSANRMKSAFIANISHEIRTPLGAIMGFAELMAEPTISNFERQNYLSIIKRNGSHLQTVIGDILDISKVEAGQLLTKRIQFSIRQLIEDVVNLERQKSLEKNISLRYRIDEKVPDQITSDPARIKQILLNIIDNALKFTHKGSVEIIVFYESSNILSPKVLFEVRDTGVGISKEHCEKIFNSFFQVDESTTRKYGGVGIGLALSRRLAQLLGGQLDLLESRPGQGSSFLITIRDQVRVSNPSHH